jgi:hypothetical protein
MASLNPEAVADYLQKYCNSRKTAISGIDLVIAITGGCTVSSHRYLSDIVEKLRLRGFPVGSDTCGYWWANESHDFAEVIAKLYRRAITTLRQITKMRKIAMPDLAGQMRLDVGSEPVIPDTLYHKFRAMDAKRDSLLVELPDELHKDCLSFLDQHPDWDQERMFTAAISLFLLQLGVNSPVPGECFVGAMGDLGDATRTS